MFELNDVYKAVQPVTGISGPVRILATVGFDYVVVIEISENLTRSPFRIRYTTWTEYILNGDLVRTTDPYELFSAAPTGMPPGASERLKRIISVVGKIASQKDIFLNTSSLNAAIKSIVVEARLSEKTIRRWVYEWFKSGGNAAAVVGAFTSPSARKTHNPQLVGKKRGAKASGNASSDVSAAEAAPTIIKAYEKFILTRKMTWLAAYFEMLITMYGVPPEAIAKMGKGLLMEPVLLTKYRLPTLMQFRYRCRELAKNRAEVDYELPRGSRGSARDSVPGPGFFEIDATFFQIQLVSRLTKSLLVGRPIVYLIVDIYDGTIVGYAVTLENPSWATAALALHNCFSDKNKTFERLGLDFTTEDWPCHHLPSMLRADRAELVSNMGHNFNLSGIKVEITPSMTPEAKGTVEGKHSHLKKKNGRFDLPGRYSKILKRRESNGKKKAALDIFEFEKILVEIIMDLNHSPVKPDQIPPDALAFGSKVATRIGLHSWALEHRAGFTRNMPQNFIYEFLLTQGKGSVTPQGIKLNGEKFSCDRLRELGLLNRALDRSYKISVSFNPHFASELYFFDTGASCWVPAYNIDPEIYRIKASFSEAKEYRSLQKLLVDQASLENHVRRNTRSVHVRKSIKEAVYAKNSSTMRGQNAKDNIIASRAEERASERTSGMNGAIPLAPNKLINTNSPKREKNILTECFPSLWDKVNEINKT
ncbi:hypothetical protein AABC73_25300 [Pseudomonas sp. G.S.17]|uniref:hypothetical protein n=1 Tax=Pseudomonas sp. G.S.17 TaxID=3137451 RepID=UPI00311C9DB9